MAWLGRTHVAPAGRRAGLMQIESSVASEAGGPVYRPIGVRGRRLLNVVFACRPLGLFDVHCEEGACSLSHDICRDSGDGVYEMQLVRSPWSSPPPSCNQCVLILTTAPRHRLYKFLLFFIISLSCSWHTDCPMLPSAPHKRTNTIIAGLSVCGSVALPDGA